MSQSEGILLIIDAAAALMPGIKNDREVDSLPEPFKLTELELVNRCVYFKAIEIPIREL